MNIILAFILFPVNPNLRAPQNVQAKLRSHLEIKVAQGQEPSSSMWSHLTCGLEILGHEVFETQA